MWFVLLGGGGSRGGSRLGDGVGGGAWASCFYGRDG